MEELNLYMKRCGFNVGNHYLDHNASRQMVISLAEVIQTNARKEIFLTNSFVSLSLDESTDNSNESKLCIIIRYCEEFQVRERYFAITKLNNGLAETIFSKAWDLIYIK